MEPADSELTPEERRELELREQQILRDMEKMLRQAEGIRDPHDPGVPCGCVIIPLCILGFMFWVWAAVKLFNLLTGR